eukprot:jgi/Chlat1/6593/Chrsp46S06089
MDVRRSPVRHTTALHDATTKASTTCAVTRVRHFRAVGQFFAECNESKQRPPLALALDIILNPPAIVAGIPACYGVFHVRQELRKLRTDINKDFKRLKEGVTTDIKKVQDGVTSLDRTFTSQCAALKAVIRNQPKHHMHWK